MKFVLSSSFLINILIGTASAENTMGCVSNFEQGKDYFPDKIEVEKSEHWIITYENSYKILKNTHAAMSYLLYQCGTDIPQDEVSKHNVTIPIPLPDDFGLHYTTFIPYMELLGKRGSISSMYGSPSWVYSPCLSSNIDDGLVTFIDNLNNETLIDELQVDVNTPYFVGVGTPNVFPNNFEISEWKETSMLGTLEWIKFFSVFFNMEKEANTIFMEAEDHVNCASENADIISADGPKPVVLWGSYSDYCGGWDVARSCPNYYCELATTCDATILTSMDGSVDSSQCYRNYMTTEEFVEYGKDADVWIYAGHSDGVDTILTTYGDELNDFKSIKNGEVYDVSGQTMDGWFGVRLVEPDALIQDFCKVVGKENPAVAIPHQLTFLRHLDDPIASKAVCADTSAPYVKLSSECSRIIPVEESPEVLEDEESHSDDSHVNSHDMHAQSNDVHTHSDDSHASSKKVFTATILTAASLALI